MIAMGSSLITLLFAMVIYLLIFLFIVGIFYLVIRKAVMHGILDARAKIKELEEGAPQTPQQ